MATQNQKVVQPSKEQVRIWMKNREFSRLPPTSIEEIRRQLGWHMVPDNGR